MLHCMNELTASNQTSTEPGRVQRQAYQSPHLSLLGQVCHLTEAGSAGESEKGNCTDDMGMTNRAMC